VTVLGIDYDSEAVHLALIDEDTGRLVSTWKADLACGPGDAFTRARRVRHLLPGTSRLEAFGVTAAAVELPYSKFAASLVPLMRVQGAIVASLPRDLRIVELRPQTWKKHSVGRSNATKHEVREWALGQGVPAGLDQDTYDAYGLARALLALEEVKAAA
jgi:Holliday junction resolvasome RuvABC endonuclease subunit